MLTSFDDYPIHQGSLPVALTATSDPNHYDRYFFNGYHRDGSLYFAAAMGLYPNRHVADAAFSVVRNGEQVNVHASRRAPLDRLEANTVGPIRVEIVEPMRVQRLHVDAPEHGLRAELTLTARTDAIQEPYFHRRVGHRVQFDYTRLTQFGSWSGWIELDGERIDVAPDATWGSRDRSWGIRPVGEHYAYGAPTGVPQFYWLWAPVNFESFCLHFDVNEDSSGRRWHEEALWVPLGGPPEARRSEYELEWLPGTRRAASFELTLHDDERGEHAVARFESLVTFQMLGIGYGHPEWGHGRWKGEHEVGGDRWTLPVPDPTAPHHVHIQELCRGDAHAARWNPARRHRNPRATGNGRPPPHRPHRFLRRQGPLTPSVTFVRCRPAAPGSIEQTRGRDG